MYVCSGDDDEESASEEEEEEDEDEGLVVTVEPSEAERLHEQLPRAKRHLKKHQMNNHAAGVAKYTQMIRSMKDRLRYLDSEEVTGTVLKKRHRREARVKCMTELEILSQITERKDTRRAPSPTFMERVAARKRTASELDDLTKDVEVLYPSAPLSFLYSSPFLLHHSPSYTHLLLHC